MAPMLKYTVAFAIAAESWMAVPVSQRLSSFPSRTLKPYSTPDRSPMHAIRLSPVPAIDGEAIVYCPNALPRHYLCPVLASNEYKYVLEPTDKASPIKAAVEIEFGA